MYNRTQDWAHALMQNELARREQRPGTIIAVEYPYQYYSRRRYADVVRFGQDHLTVYQANTQLFDLGETIRDLRDGGHVLPLYEETFKYRTFSAVYVRLVLLATVENAELVVDNLDMLAGIFGDGRTPGPDGVSYGLSLLDPLDEDTCPVRIIPIGQLPSGRLGALLGRLTPYEERRDFGRAYGQQRRSSQVAVTASGFCIGHRAKRPPGSLRTSYGQEG